MWDRWRSPTMRSVIATSRIPTPSARPARRVALGLTAALACVLPAAAANAATIAVPSGAGITMPLGIAQSADTSSVWIADEMLGVCRVTLATATAPAAVVQSQYCLPEVEAEPVAGEPGPPPAPGPSGAGPLAYDPISSSLFVAEGTSKGAGVWRMQLDATGTEIESAVKVVNLGGNRVTALSLSPAGDIDFTADDDALVRRLAGAATAAPGTPPTVVGVAQSQGVASLTHLGTALYLADGSDVTRIATPGAGNINAVPVAGFGASAPTALAADQSRGLVFAGTSLPSTADRVQVLTPGGTVETYATGFAGVTALTIAADGTLYIGDDPAAAAGHPESAEQGRVHVETRHATGLPQVTFSAQPDPYSALTSATFTYTASTGGEFSCRLDASAWAACDAGSTFTGLSDGTHVFEVRASAPGGETGPVARGSFVVDTRAPDEVQVDNAPSDHWITKDRLRLSFSTNESYVRYDCSIDDEPIWGCDSPTDLRDLRLGDHDVVLTATDLAGNTSRPNTWRFTRLLPPAAAAVAAAAPVAAATAADAPDPATAPATGSSARSSCKTVRAPAGTGSYTLSARRDLAATVRPPRLATFAKLTLRKRTAGGPVEALAMRPVTAGRRSTLRVKLLDSYAERLRTRRYRLTIAFGTCRTTVGSWSELKKARRTTPKTRNRKGF